MGGISLWRVFSYNRGDLFTLQVWSVATIAIKKKRFLVTGWLCACSDMKTLFRRFPQAAEGAAEVPEGLEVTGASSVRVPASSGSHGWGSVSCFR